MDLFTGQATVRVPIEVPPGTGESTPGVALVYGSHGSNRDGALGVGWALDIGPATIERSTKLGAPAYDETDTFVYGGKDLIETATPGRFVSEEFDHTRIEFVASGLFGYWRVLRPDGTRLYYGFENAPSGPSANESVTTSIRVNPVSPTQASCPVPPRPLPSTSPVCHLEPPIVEGLIPFSWHLDRVEDRNGNVVRYRWQSLGDKGARYLTEISFSAHVAGAREQVPSFGGSDDGTLTRARKVRLVYGLVRTDAFATYRTGFPRVVAHRLTDIIAEVDSALIRHYVLEYEESPVSGRSRLTALRERGASDSPADERVTNFYYGDGTAKGWGPLDTTFALPSGLAFTTAGGRDRGIRIFDVNGDGWVDVVQGESGLRRTFLGGPSGFASAASSTWAPPANFVDSVGFTGLVVGDFDGDGLPDYLQRRLRVTGSLARAGASCGTSIQHQVAASFQSGMWRNTGAGWVNDAANAPQAPFPDVSTVSDYPPKNSCPDEFLPTSIELQNVNAGFDQATRVVDINGDGLDDLAWNRVLQGFYVESPTVAQHIDEVRAGTLLNTGQGFAGAIPNDFVYSMFDPLALEGGNYLDYAHFLKLHRFSRWQTPAVLFDDAIFPFPFGNEFDFHTKVLNNWSAFNTCVGFDRLAEAHTGAEALVDLNGDGLPDIIEAYEQSSASTLQWNLTYATFFNNGYTWRPEFAETTESFWVLDRPLNAIKRGELALPSCSETAESQSFDGRLRVLDINGDGGPDLLGDGMLQRPDGALATSSTWNASQQGLWRADPAWNAPVSFAYGGSGTDPVVRLVDVNADGLVDLLQANGARLNRSEPPDKLERIESPFGAVTTIAYAPSTDADFVTAPPPNNPVVNGQRRHGSPLWVVREISTDAGAGFGQPVVDRYFDFVEPVYDVADRGFRGFRIATVRANLVDGRRRLDRTWFHTRDGLSGRIAQQDVWEEIAGASARLLTRTLHTWTVSSAADPNAARFVGTTPIADLPPGDLQAQAFTDFRGLLAGTARPHDAYLAFSTASEERSFEGASTVQRSRRIERTFDIHGNAIREIARGDTSTGTDDVTTTRSFAILDAVVGGQRVYLVDRPFQIVTSGVQGELPLGTTLQQATFVYYDHDLTVGGVARGNPTIIDRAWTRNGQPTVLRTSMDYDVYGNRTVTSSERDPNAPGAATIWNQVIEYDAASRTFPTRVTFASPLVAGSALVTTIDYELPGCGAPLGLGRVCRTTDPTGQVTNRFYDTWGRMVREEGANGSVLAVLHHDADRGTSDQRIELRVRWNPDGPTGSAVATDSNALVQTRFYDGVLRTISEERSGQASAVARRFLDYDGAGRLVSVSRWDFAATPVAATTFAYDGLDRVVRELLPDGSRTERIYESWQVTEEVWEASSGLRERRRERVDGLGQLAAVDEWEHPTSPVPFTTSYRYDPFGQLAVVRNPAANDPTLCNGHTASPACAGQSHEQRLFYDQVGNRIRLEDPDGGISAWSYDGAGLVAQQWRGNGQSHVFTYDALGRTKRIHPVNPPTPEADVVFTYGAANAAPLSSRGRLIRVDDDEGYELFGYDAAGNLAAHTRTVGGKRFSFFHVSDPLGRRQQTTYPDGEVATWHYDKALLTRISSSGGSYDGDYLSGAVYDALDRPTFLGAGGSPGSSVAFQAWAYDAVTGELDRTFATRTSDFATLANLNYRIDGIGRVLQLATTTHRAGTTTGPALESRTFNYFYDGMRRLRTANGPLSPSPTTNQIFQYRYDPLGNLREIDSVPVAHAHPEKPHWPSAQHGFVPIEADAEGAIASRGESLDGVTVGRTAVFTHDSLGRPRQTGDLVHGYDWTGRRVRTQATAGVSSTLLEPEPGYSYETGLVNKHFFVAGRRVAASAKSWTAPSASAPVLWAPGWPRLPMPPPWAWGLAYAGALGGLLVVAARRRPLGTAPRGLRIGAVAVLATVAPTLIVGCPPSGKPFGSFGDAALFFVTDAVGSTILAIRPNGSVRNRFLYRPYGQKIVNEGGGESGLEKLSHGFAGGAIFRVNGGSLYAFGPRLYDPKVGHFYQPDPLLGDPSSPQTMQPYGYALGDPLRLADPTGLFSEEGPVSSPPSFRLPFDPFSPGIVVAQPKPVNKPGNVPPSPAVGFQEGPGQFSDVLIAGAAIGVLTPFPGDEVALGGLAVIVGGITIGQLLDQILNRPGMLQQSDKNPGKTVEEVLKDAKPGRKTKGRTKQFEKPGGIEEANADFDSLKPEDVRGIPGGGRTGRLPDGRQAVVRPSSSDGRPTLEIQRGPNPIKIRFGD